MTRPAMQFYFGDWRKNANLRRCSPAARGYWIDLMGVLHDSDEYGVVRWPLKELARAAAVPMRYARELAEKGVLKGSDGETEAYTFAPRHGGRVGPNVILLEKCSGPCWFSSKMLRDEYVRNNRGFGSRFPRSDAIPADTKPIPMGGIGDGLGSGIGYGASASASSSASALDVSSGSVGSSSARTPLSNARVRTADEEAEQQQRRAEDACAVMEAAGIPRRLLNAQDALLIAAVRQGGLPGMFEQPARRAMKPGITDPFAYTCTAVIGRLRDAAKAVQQPAPSAERGPMRLGDLLRRAVGGGAT